MTELMAKSKFADVKFPLDEVTRYTMLNVPACIAVAAYPGAHSVADGIEVTLTGGMHCRLTVDGLVFTDAIRSTVAFVGQMTTDFTDGAEWFPCFGDVDFVKMCGGIVVHNRCSAGA